MSIELSPFESGIYEYPSRNGKIHRFMINKMVVPTGIGYEAEEITKNNVPGYKVAILDDINCDQDYLFYKLEAKIKYTLSKRYLKTGTYPNGMKYTGLKDDEVVGLGRATDWPCYRVDRLGRNSDCLGYRVDSLGTYPNCHGNHLCDNYGTSPTVNPIVRGGYGTIPGYKDIK